MDLMLFSMESRDIQVKSPTVTAQDSTGAGDTFAGAFLHYICMGKDIMKQTRFRTFSPAKWYVDGGQGYPTKKLNLYTKRLNWASHDFQALRALIININ